jgi:hypothetical protein
MKCVLDGPEEDFFLEAFAALLTLSLATQGAKSTSHVFLMELRELQLVLSVRR